MTAADKSEKSITIVMRAYATSDNSDSPGYATAEISECYLNKLEQLLVVCKENQLSQVRQDAGPDWGPGSVTDDMRLRGDVLVVSRHGDMWYSAYPKYGDFDVETGMIEIANIRKEFESAETGAVVYMTDEGCLDEIRELYESDHSIEDQSLNDDVEAAG